jgi:transposase
MAEPPKGRPSKLTPEVQETIVKYLRAGNSFKTACECAGIGASTGLEWRARGEDRHCDRESDDIYAAFAEATRKAEHDAIARNVALIQKAGAEGNWQASAWFLERRRPEEWGRADRRPVIGSSDSDVPQLGSGLSVDQIKARILELAAELGYTPPPSLGPADVIEVEATDVGPG